MIYLNNIHHFSSVIEYECLDCQFDQVCTDTRGYKNNSLFVAITGERFNAFEYVSGIIQQGCDCIVYTHSKNNEKLLEEYRAKFPRVKFIKVLDSIEFLQELAKDHTQRLKALNPNLKLVSISGSNGKTTCKEILRHLLSSYQIVATQKNDNNHLGVPLTLLRLGEQTQFGIIELGSNHPGEIQAIFNLFVPDHVYVTNIGMTHMEFFPTLEDVYMEEGYPLRNLIPPTQGWLNTDDEILKSHLENEKFNYVGEFSQSFKLKNDSIHIWDQEIKNPNLLGEYNYHNLGVMLSIAKSLGVQIAELVELAQTYKPELMRSQWVECGKTKVFLDAYNANPSSMKLSLEAFVNFVKNKKGNLERVKIIIGDMKELGEMSSQRHLEIGEYLSGIDLIEQVKCYFVGEFVNDFQTGFESGENIKASGVFENVEKLKNSEEKLFEDCEYLFLKASRSLKFENILS